MLFPSHKVLELLPTQPTVTIGVKLAEGCSDLLLTQRLWHLERKLFYLFGLIFIFFMQEDLLGNIWTFTYVFLKPSCSELL